ncbi:MAG: glucose-6-phosphate isomerase, partial [Acidimicrobiales bacterium]
MSELLERLLSRDVTLWPEGNVAPNRLGWLDVAAMQGLTGELEAWANDIGPTRVVLPGMGGSSLNPLVL